MTGAKTAVNGVLPPPILRHIHEGESERLADALLAMSEADRRALVPALTERVRTIPAWSSDAGPLLVAGAACLPTASQAAAWFGRSTLRFGLAASRDGVVNRAVVRVLLARDVPWIADFATRLATALPDRNVDVDRWRLVADLVTAGGGPIPTGNGFVLGWLAHLTAWSNQSVSARLFLDPLTDTLLPRIFETDGAGAILGRERWLHGSDRMHATYAYTAVTSLVAAGRFDRSRAVSGTIGRLLRGDDRDSIRTFTRLYDDLAPTVAEAAEYIPDYLKILPDAPGPVASLAQRALKSLDDAGCLSATERVAASEAVLDRTEKALVKAQLSWVDTAARRAPAQTGPLVATVALAFGHPSLDIQDRAVAIAIRHAGQLDEADRVRIVDAVDRLDGAVRRRAADAFPSDHATPPDDPAVPPDEPIRVMPAPVLAPMPAPIASPAELAATAVAYLRSVDDRSDVIELEQILDAVVRLTYQNRAGVVEALTAVQEQHADWFVMSADVRDTSVPPHVVNAIVAPLGGVRPADPRRFWRDRLGRKAVLVPDLPYVRQPGPRRVLLVRLDEIAVNLLTAPIPFLLATPTHRTGHVAAATLVARIAAYEAAGVTPWPYDLEQALLRLPGECDDAALAAAQQLRSEAGTRLVQRLVDGPVPSTSERITVEFDAGSFGYSSHAATGSWFRTAVATIADEEALGPLGRVLFAVELDVKHTYYMIEPDVAAWPALLPSHREVIAAHALYCVAGVAEEDRRGYAAILPPLAECAGAIGPAFTLAITFGLGARHLPDRTAAVDALMLVAGDIDPVALGVEIGIQCTTGRTKLARVVVSLAETARSGAGLLIGRVALAAVPAILTAATPPAGAPALFELASKHYSSGGEQVRSALAAIAGRSGSSRLVTEARRLIQTIDAAA